MESEQKLLNRKQLALAIGVHPKTILRYRKKGMPYIQMPGRAVRYDFEEIKQWLKNKNGRTDIQSNEVDPGNFDIVNMSPSAGPEENL